jgi:hypothetical protein
MPHWNNQPWQRNLSKTASGKPGAVQDEPEINGLCNPIGPLFDAGAARRTAMDHFGLLTSRAELIGGEGKPKSFASPNQDNLPCAFSAQISTSTEAQ